MTDNKALGNEQFKAKNFEKAIEFYSQAIEQNPSDHSIYGNRSASYFNLKDFRKALDDADKCIELKDDWSKGYQRKGMALHGMGDRAEALLNYKKGLEKDPNNAQIKTEMAKL